MEPLLAILIVLCFSAFVASEDELVREVALGVGLIALIVWLAYVTGVAASLRLAG